MVTAMITKISSKNTGVHTSNPLFWLGITTGLVVLYWGISQIHANICAPKGLSGLIYTAISMGSPICQAIIRILSYTSSFYFAIWSAIIVTIISTGWHLMGYLGVRRINTHELRA